MRLLHVVSFILLHMFLLTHAINNCSPGKYSLETDANTCNVCPIGNYCPLIDNNMPQYGTIQIPCPPGTYMPYTGAASINECSLCEIGTYQINEGAISMQSCLSCPIGYECNDPSKIPIPVVSVIPSCVPVSCIPVPCIPISTVIMPNFTIPTITVETVTVPTFTVPTFTTATITIPTFTITTPTFTVTKPNFTIPTFITPSFTTVTITTPTFTTFIVTKLTFTTHTFTTVTIATRTQTFTTFTITVPTFTVMTVTATMPTFTVPTITIPTITVTCPAVACAPQPCLPTSTEVTVIIETITTQPLINDYYVEFYFSLNISDSSSITDSQLATQLTFIFINALDILSNQINIMINAHTLESRIITSQVRFFSTMSTSAETLLTLTQTQLADVNSKFRQANLTAQLNQNSLTNISRHYICSNRAFQESLSISSHSSKLKNKLSTILLVSIIPSIVIVCLVVIVAFFVIKRKRNSSFITESSELIIFK